MNYARINNTTYHRLLCNTFVIRVVGAAIPPVAATSGVSVSFCYVRSVVGRRTYRRFVTNRIHRFRGQVLQLLHGAVVSFCQQVKQTKNWKRHDTRYLDMNGLRNTVEKCQRVNTISRHCLRDTIHRT